MTNTNNQQLRGLGRAAYRARKHASESTVFASTTLGRPLDERERALVMAGWRDERAETSGS